MGAPKGHRRLKCPNHDHVRDSHYLLYESIGSISPDSGTRCRRCGCTMALHKPQNQVTEWFSTTSNALWYSSPEKQEQVDFVINSVDK